MRLLLYIFIGGGIGSVLRFTTSRFINESAGDLFPWGTMFVNLAGAFAIGLLIELCDNSLISVEMKALLVIGFLGGFTTFSTFSVESVSLLRSGNMKMFLINLLATNISGVILTVAGITLSKFFIKYIR